MYLGLFIFIVSYWVLRINSKLLNKRYYVDLFFLLLIIIWSFALPLYWIISRRNFNFLILGLLLLIGLYHTILAYMKLDIIDNKYRWIHHHNRAVVNYDIPHEEFSTVTSDGVNIVGIFIGNQDSDRNKAVIVCHGASRSKYSAPIVQTCMILATKYNVFTFDFRGHMDSGGTFFLDGEEQDNDLNAVIDYVISKGFNDLAIVGWSIGGASTIRCVANGKPIKAFVAGAPAIELPDAGEIGLLRNPLTRYIVQPALLLTRQVRVSVHTGTRTEPTTLNAARMLPNIPMLLVYNDYDYVLRIDAMKFEEYFEVFPSSKQLLRLPGRGHLFDWPNNFFFWRELMDWLEENFV